MKHAKTCLIILCVISVVVAVCVLCFYKREVTASFSDEFTEKFIIADFNCDDVRERAKNNGYYRISVFSGCVWGSGGGTQYFSWISVET